MSHPSLRLEYVDPATLGPNPANWRRHSAGQRAAFDHALGSVGWVLPLAYNEATGHLIDGHIRREQALAAGLPTIPVVVGSWSIEQERTILATLDPLGDMADGDPAAFASLLDVLDATGPLMELAAITADALGLYEGTGGEGRPEEADDEGVHQPDEVAQRPVGKADVPDVVFPSDNEWGIPTLDVRMQADAVDFPVTMWRQQSYKAPMAGTWAFYVDDAKFESLWDDPSTLTRSGAVNVVEPNFSTHEQHPRAFTLWQVYRKRWIARWAQTRGLRLLVDLNVHESAEGLNLMGVPRGWRAYATRSHDGGAKVGHDFAVARERAGSADVLFLVVGGGSSMKARCGDEGWYWAPDANDVPRAEIKATRYARGDSGRSQCP